MINHAEYLRFVRACWPLPYCGRVHPSSVEHEYELRLGNDWGLHVRAVTCVVVRGSAAGEASLSGARGYGIDRLHDLVSLCLITVG